ncbi:MAG TPA: hydroxymethylpyrimidine/phosphomethylpyrimidine kinase [Acidobacteriaceae bacterium]|nr:hydroxymethylpyrimidine/phosphomethylpyrimidine kinase [Acidobacteriaceae bacterium]
MKTVLTIAGYDPSSGAGVTADLMVFAAHGLFGTSCITALTVQSTLGVQSTHPVESNVVRETLGWLDQDLRPAGVKIGMVGNASTCLEIGKYVETFNPSYPFDSACVPGPVVLDPVVRSSSGLELLDVPGATALREHLLPVVSWITPNLEELALLSGKVVQESGDIPAACCSLQEATERKGNGGALGIFAKGGHLDKPDDYLLTPGGDGYWLPGERVTTKATHGTGCALSSAFLSELVLGREPFEAARRAKAYVADALKNNRLIGSGVRSMNHLWNLAKVID